MIPVSRSPEARSTYWTNRETLLSSFRAGPQLVGQGLGVGGGDGHLPGLALKGGEGIQILLIGVDEAALAGLGVVIAEEIAAAAGGVAVVALQDGQGVAAVLVEQAGDAGGVVVGVGLKLPGAQGLGKDLALQQPSRMVSVWSPLVTTVSSPTMRTGW